jgi:hypothetical protein
MSSWLYDVSVNVASALLAAGAAIGVAAQVKACRINSMLREIEENLERMLHGVQKKMNEFRAAAHVEEAKAHILRVQEEAISDSSKGLRLPRRLIRELEEIKAEIAGLDEELLGRMVLNLLYGEKEGSDFVASVERLRGRIASVRMRIFFLTFFMP